MVLDHAAALQALRLNQHERALCGDMGRSQGAKRPKVDSASSSSRDSVMRIRGRF
jgi:hypothetical protein